MDKRFFDWRIVPLMFFFLSILLLTAPAHACQVDLGDGEMGFHSSIYGTNEAVYVTGKLDELDSFGTGTADVYITENRTWRDGDALVDVMGSKNTIVSVLGGEFFDRAIALPPLTPGEYDIVVDEAQNGVYNADLDCVLGEGAEYGFKVEGAETPGVSIDVDAIKARAAGLASSLRSRRIAWEWGMAGVSFASAAMTWADISLSLAAPAGLVSGIALTAGIVASGVPGTVSGFPMDYNSAVCNAGMEIIGRLFNNLAQENADLAADPADPNYQQLAELGAVDRHFTQGSSTFEAAQVALSNVIEQQAAIERALITSIERYQGAQQANDEYWELLQGKAMKRFSDMLVENMTTSSQLLGNFADEIQKQGSDKVIHADDVRAFQERIRTSGLAEGERQSLKNVGLTDEQIDSLEQAIISIDTSELQDGSALSSVQDIQANINGAIPDFQAFSQNVAAFIQSSEQTVQTTHPVSVPGGPYSGNEGTAISFDGNASSDPDGTIHTYSWDLDGNGVFGDQTGSTVEWTYDKEYTGLVGLKVTDNDGNEDVAYAKVSVASVNSPPVIASCSPTDPSVRIAAGTDTTIAFSVEATDPDSDPLAYSWTLDGVEKSTADNWTYSPTLDESGIKQVQVEISDGNQYSNDIFEQWMVSFYTGEEEPGATTETEPNDEFGQADPLDSGADITGTVDPVGDVDYYSFTASRGDRVIADIDAVVLEPSSPLDSELFLLDTDGETVLTSNDDYDGYDSHIEYVLSESGTYFLRVQEYGNDAGGPEFAYKLSLTVQENTDAFEPNDDSASAIGMSDGDSLSAVITPTGDFDYYSFTASHGDRVIADIDARVLEPSSPLDSELFLLDTDGETVLTSNDDDGDTYDSYIEYVLSESGTYFLRVQDRGNNAGGPEFAYKLKLLIMGANPPRVNIMPAYYSWPSREITIWGNVHWGSSESGTYVWDFGDGSPPDSGDVDDAHYIAVEHTYATMGPKTATLTVTDGNGLSDTHEVQINVLEEVQETERLAAIEDGLRWLYLDQSTDGSWDYYGSHRVAGTGAAVLAFELQGHLPINDPNVDIYAEYIRKGLDYLFSHAYTQEIGVQEHGDPDTDGDGIGIYFRHGDRPTYEAGLAMMAIIASGNPDLIATTGPDGVNGQTYGEIIRDAVDYYAWAQEDDHSTGRGGWRYSPDAGESDNSVNQWPVIGMEAAETQWGINAPNFVKEELLIWLAYSQNENGGFGYTSPGRWVNVAKTGAGICELAYCDVPVTDSKVVNAISFLNEYWDRTGTGGEPSNYNFGDYYAMYGVTKGCRISLPPIIMIGSHNWWDEYTVYLIENQTPDGSWPTSTYSDQTLSTAWAIEVLSPGITELPPVAVIQAPSSVPPNSPVELDGSKSYHTDPTKQILLWEWDFNKEDGADWSRPDATGKMVTNETGYPLLEGVLNDTIYVTLRVTDNSDPVMVRTAERRIIVSRENHPPIADAGGPYSAKIGQEITFDGRGSHDPDEGDEIVLYEWDLDGDGEHDDATGSTPTHTWNVEYSGRIGLRVTDSHGLTNEAKTYTTVWTSKKDLCIASSDITVTNHYPNQQETVTISVNVHYSSESTGSVDNVKVRFYDGDPDVAVVQIGEDQTIAHLDPGESETVRVDWVAPDTNPHDLYVRVDPDGAIEEWDEQNNEALATVNPAVRISQLWIEPTPACLPLANFNLTTSVQVKVKEIQNLMGAHISLKFDPTKVQVVREISEGAFLRTNSPDETAFSGSYDNTNGTLTFHFALMGGEPPGVSGGGALATITFKAAAQDPTSDLTFDSYTLRDHENVPINVDAIDGRFETITDLLGDFDDDMDVDFEDYTLFVQYWNAQDLTGDIAKMPVGSAGLPAWSKTNYPFPGEGVIDFEDQMVFALMYNWYKSAAAAPLAKVVPALQMERVVGKTAVKIASQAEVPVDESFTVSLCVQNVRDLMGAMLRLRFAPNLLEVERVEQGEFLTKNGGTVSLVEEIDPSQGEIKINTVALGGSLSGVNGSGELATVTFRPLAPGESNISIAELKLRDSCNYPIPANSEGCGVLVSVGRSIPEIFALFQNYPNPFNTTTSINYQLAERTFTTLKVYNLSGQLVRTLVKEKKPAGWHSVRWDGRDSSGRAVASGIYFCYFTAGEFSKVQKMLLLK